MNDYLDDFASDNLFLNSTMEILIDKMHEYLDKNELHKAEIIASKIAELDQ
tara:strand:+ start:2357 stop:2509 length:153 start_codon:yes stop_codon:yes gene_type:complete